MSREQKIEKLIKSIWSSLESHLQYTYEKTEEGTNFHKKCVKEYAEQILTASELY